MNDLLRKIDGKKVYLYGAGNLGKRLCCFLKHHDIKIECFLDKKKSLSLIEGLKVEDPFTGEINKKDALVIVSIFNRDVNFLDIKKQLSAVGFDDIISFIEFYPCCFHKFGDWYWLSGDKDYLSDDQKNDSIYNSLCDSLSQEIFSSIIKTRKTNSYECLPNPYPIEEQYFFKDIPLNRYNEFIDCGAYDGDTLDALVNKEIPIDKIYAFEPDLCNFNKLANKIRSYGRQAVLFPCGVHSSTELLRFNSGAGEGSMISDEGDEIIQCVALDDVLIDVISGPTLLKMDIEGAELNALKGAEHLIRNHNVDLAVCLYHKPHDIIEIPQLISTFGKYNFYIRLYGHYGMELVLYAIKQS
jgi:FkbM family methyltransferase